MFTYVVHLMAMGGTNDGKPWYKTWQRWYKVVAVVTYDHASQVQAEYEKQVSKFFLNQKKVQDSESKRLRYIVPYQYKQHIRKQLQSLGINQGNIYPDIEKRSGYIKEKYRIN